jgi:predicted transcriptional regulator
MTVISSKEFATNQKKFYNLALNEQVVIKRGKNMFYLTHLYGEDDEASDLADAIAAENDENIHVDDYLKSIYKRIK